MTDDSDNSNEVRIERRFDVPIDVLWRMWTEADHFAAWYGPTGATVEVTEMDLRVGGRRHIAMSMETPNGAMQMWFVGEYREISEPARLVYTESVSDENGRVLSPSEMGMPDDHPTTTEIIVELTDAGAGTDMIMRHVGIPADSPGAAGWQMAFDTLVDHLADVTG